MPDLPLRMLSQASATLAPTGDTMPSPVTTTRRRVMRYEPDLGWRRSARPAGLELRPGSLAAVRLAVVQHVLEGSDLLGFFVRDVDFELFFESHDELDRIERIGTKVLDERGVRRDLVLAHAQLFSNDFLDLFFEAAHLRLL